MDSRSSAERHNSTDSLKAMAIRSETIPTPNQVPSPYAWHQAACVGAPALLKPRQRSASAAASDGGSGSSEDVDTKGAATQLEKIDLSECPDVRARAIGAIARNCPDLKDLTLVGCVSVGDEACEALARYSTRLRHLDLSDCQRISERGVGAIGRNVTGLAKLNVTGCKKVGRRFLLDLIDELQFCDLARDYVGYQPKKNADWLRREAERRQRELGSIIKIQALFRGAVFRTGLGAYRRRVFFERCVTKLQACERARTWRKRVAAVALADREHRAATWFAAMYRGKIARRIVAQWRNQQAPARKTGQSVVSPAPTAG